MKNLLCAFQRDDNPIRLNRQFWLDLLTWQELFWLWDSMNVFLTPTWAPIPDFQVSYYAMGFPGYGWLSVSLVLWLMVSISGPFVHCQGRAFSGGCGGSQTNALMKLLVSTGHCCLRCPYNVFNCLNLKTLTTIDFFQRTSRDWYQLQPGVITSQSLATSTENVTAVMN